MRYRQPQPFLARFGGDEFAIILSYTQHKEAVDIAERIRLAVEKAAVTTNEQTQVSVSLSIGIVAYPGSGGSVEEMIQSADTALYAARSEGKNKVCLASHLREVVVDTGRNA